MSCTPEYAEYLEYIRNGILSDMSLAVVREVAAGNGAHAKTFSLRLVLCVLLQQMQSDDETELLYQMATVLLKAGSPAGEYVGLRRGSALCYEECTPRLAELLLRFGANPNFVAGDSWCDAIENWWHTRDPFVATPLDVHIDAGNADVLEVLRQNGATERRRDHCAVKKNE